MFFDAMTRRSALAVLPFVLACPLWAQTTIADPDDAIYADLDEWETKGRLRNLPRLRPYTMAMTIGLLKEVVAGGDPRDAEEAQRDLDLLADHALHPLAVARAEAAVSPAGTDCTLTGSPGFAINTLVGENLGVSARMDQWLPEGDLSYGDLDLGVQAGFMHGSWGPIYDDGIVLGPQSPESGQLTFSWRSPELTTDFGFFMLRQGWPDSMGLVDPEGDPVGLGSRKYLVIHGLNWAPTSSLELGVFESMVWVDRLEPLYFIPLSEYFLSQSVSGYGDNAFVGLSASVYLPGSMKLDLVGYADDLDFSGVLKGSFDTKWKMAAQARLSWAPESPIVQRLSLDYTAVGPYTYTHWARASTDASGNSYFGALAYTNGGRNIGPDLDPDSDRITLRAKSRTMSGAQVSGILRLTRHGNASAGVEGYTAATSASGDASGGLGDPGLVNLGTPLAPNYTWIFQGDYDTGSSPRYFRFLTQSALQITAQAGIAVDYTKRIEKLGTLSASFGYTFEYVVNRNCVPGAAEIANYLSFAIGLAL